MKLLLCYCSSCPVSVPSLTPNFFRRGPHNYRALGNLDSRNQKLKIWDSRDISCLERDTDGGANSQNSMYILPTQCRTSLFCTCMIETQQWLKKQAVINKATNNLSVLFAFSLVLLMNPSSSNWSDLFPSIATILLTRSHNL